MKPAQKMKKPERRIRRGMVRRAEGSLAGYSDKIDVRRIREEIEKELKARNIEIVYGALEKKPVKEAFIKIEPTDLKRNLVDYRRIYANLKHFLGSLKGKRIVHIGSGPSIFTPFLEKKDKANAHSLDTNKYFLKGSKRISGTKGIAAEAEKTPFKDNSIDAIASDHFLFSAYASIEDEKVLQEAGRILKKGGIIVIERAIMGEAQKLMAEKNGFEIIEAIGKNEKIEPAGRHEIATKIYVLRKK